MEVFERVTEVLKAKKLARYQLAEMVGAKQNTFNRYFDLENQDKLTPYLWKILELFPDISRDWLFFGEGEMTAGSPEGDNAAVTPVPSSAQSDDQESLTLEERVAKLENELEHIYRAMDNRVVTIRRQAPIHQFPGSLVNTNKTGNDKSALLGLENNGIAAKTIHRPLGTARARRRQLRSNGVTVVFGKDKK